MKLMLRGVGWILGLNLVFIILISVGQLSRNWLLVSERTTRTLGTQRFG
jgi:hypothetical protein